MEKNRSYSLLKDEQATAQLDKKGYVVLPLLSSDQIAELLSLFANTTPEVKEHYYASIDSEDKEYKRIVDEGIRNVIAEPLIALLKSFELMTGNFIVKKPGKDSIVYVHTDWNFSEEFDGSPLVIWIPLSDVNKKNGAIEVVEGSHHFVPKVRGPGIPNTLLPFHKFLRRKFTKLVPMKAGEVLFFKSNLIHCSPSNLSKETRVAIRIEVVPQGRKMILYYQDDEKVSEVEIYKIPKDFFTTYKKWERPKDVEFVRTFGYMPPHFTKRILRRHLNLKN